MAQRPSKHSTVVSNNFCDYLYFERAICQTDFTRKGREIEANAVNAVYVAL